MERHAPNAVLGHMVRGLCLATAVTDTQKRKSHGRDGNSPDTRQNYKRKFGEGQHDTLPTEQQ